jgi:hypothetical protein
VSPERDTKNGPACTLALCGKSMKYVLVDSAGQPTGPEVGKIDWIHGYLVKLTLKKQAILIGRCEAGIGMGSVRVP